MGFCLTEGQASLMSSTGLRETDLQLDASSGSNKDLAFKKGESFPSISDLRDFASLAGSSDISEVKKNTEEKRFKES